MKNMIKNNLESEKQIAKLYFVSSIVLLVIGSILVITEIGIMAWFGILLLMWGNNISQELNIKENKDEIN